MKKGFTIIEVSILFVIFLIVAFLVAPLSIDDTIQAKRISRWRSAQNDFTNIIYSINTQRNENNKDFNDVFETTINDEFITPIKPYTIKNYNGTINKDFVKNYKSTRLKATVAYNLYDEPKDDILGIIIYDVNGMKSPNTLGKDVFGYNIYKDSLQPFCKNKSINEQRQDCNKNGTGLCCSNYYLIGGHFD